MKRLSVGLLRKPLISKLLHDESELKIALLIKQEATTFSLSGLSNSNSIKTTPVQKKKDGRTGIKTVSEW